MARGSKNDWEKQIDDAQRQIDDARRQIDNARRDAREAGLHAREEARAAGRLAKEEARAAAREESHPRRRRALGGSDDNERGSIWSLPEPGSRRASYSREQIAQTAMAIADVEGFAAVSMRRVAAELGAGTMTLYHYIRDKDDLVALMEDEMMRELHVLDDQLSDDWRESIAEIARRSRAALVRHKWTSDVPAGSEGGPNGMLHFEQSLQALRGTGLPFIEKMRINALIDDFVFGFAMRENMVGAVVNEGGSEWVEQAWEATQVQLERGSYPEISAWVAEGQPAEALKQAFETISDPDRFEEGLQTLLDGIELQLAQDEKSRKRSSAARKSGTKRG